MRQVVAEGEGAWRELLRLGCADKLGQCKHCKKGALVLSKVQSRGRVGQVFACCKKCGRYENAMCSTAFRGTKLSPGEVLDVLETMVRMPLTQRPTADEVARQTGLGRRSVRSIVDTVLKAESLLGDGTSGLLPDAYGSTSQARARDTAERYAERLLREQDFSVKSCAAFLHELQLAWETEPQCARPDYRKKRNLGTERRRMIFGAYRYGGMVGVTNLTRLWPSTVKFLNAFLKKQSEEQGVSAEGWNALQVSFSAGIAVHRGRRTSQGHSQLPVLQRQVQRRRGVD